MSAALRPLPAPTPVPSSHGNPSPLWSSPPAPFEPFDPADPTATPASAFVPTPFARVPLPGLPAEGEHEFPPSWPVPLAVLPDAPATAPVETPQPRVFRPAPVDFPHVPQPHETLVTRLEPLAKEGNAAPAADFNDDDLREAFGPIVEQAVRSAVYARENGIDTYLEPMLRATIRRALAEYTPTQRPFQEPGTLDRMLWRLQALFTSRTYEDIVFEKTHRFQVEEVFLLDVHSLALVSFASNQPGRHASAKRVEGTVQRLALQLRDADGHIRSEFELPEHRFAVSREGRFAVLVAIVRGRSNELVTADLEFSLKRLEDHFRERFAPGGPPLMKDLQPFLEDCLLIQAPAHAA
ncbi:hypothetical protein [Luteolibacter sp. LG18]|uniref:hypothetical protein n=1 Tax=Luteolibacter sp. LG18 TaxID=2819286 RepID=UPI002B31FAF1|nr:hypothetical protein llg_34880 [Luteolibacter sp. LG18]